MRTVLTVAGSDCSGGAGIQADIKTITAHGLYAMSAITALTAQNTTGVYGVQETTAEFVGQQLDCIFQDIVPHGIKIGMVANHRIIEVIADKLQQYEGKNIVIDPVMISTSGSRLLNEDAMEALCSRLLPMGTVITPNIPEAEALWGQPVTNSQEMQQAAEGIWQQIRTAVLIKGGHGQGPLANDLLYDGREYVWFEAPRIDNPNTHGTGCTLSSAIACHLAQGLSLIDSVAAAKAYINQALAAQLNLGQGRGPLNHMVKLKIGVEKDG